MNIRVNGEKKEFDTVSTLSDLFNSLKLSPESVVVELNTKIIPPDSYATTQLAEGDAVELIQFVGGG